VLVILSVWYAVAIAGLLAVDGSVAVVAMLLFWGLALNAVFPIFYAITADNAPEATGSAMGLLLMLTFFGQVPASPLAGYLIDHYGGYKQIGGYVAGFAIAVPACCLPSSSASSPAGDGHTTMSACRPAPSRLRSANPATTRSGCRRPLPAR